MILFENIFEFFDLLFGEAWMVVLGSFLRELVFGLIYYCFWYFCWHTSYSHPGLVAGVGEC